LKSLKTELVSGKSSYDQEKNEEIILPDMDEPKKMLDNFYNREKERWANSGYTPEDIEKQFSEENLKKLSVEDYILLMKRFPGEMVTHVTRQGIRDHASSFWHTAGTGAFSNGFKEVLKSKSLRSSLGIAIQESSKEDAMAKFLHLNSVQSRSDALLMYRDNFEYNIATSNAFADRASVHVASENVMDAMYGSERGNEIFIAYPSAYVASQFNYGGKGTLADTGADQHNDKWIYTKEQAGMPIDAGLVFIPKDAQVDPKNGSRYEIGADNNPIKNESAYRGLRQLATSPELEAIAQKIRKKLGRLNDSEKQSLPLPSAWEGVLKKSESHYAYVPHKDVLESLLPIRDRIIEITGMTDDRILEKILDYNNIGNLESAIAKTDEYERNLGVDAAISETLKQSGTYYVEAQNTISSEEYWNQYFAAHPNEKPSKIVFYSGGDPSRALNEWRRKNDIVKRTEDSTYGFSEHRVSEKSEEANEEKDRFASFALKVIDDRFPDIQKNI
jgi:hypothetical protein